MIKIKPEKKRYWLYLLLLASAILLGGLVRLQNAELLQGQYLYEDSYLHYRYAEDIISTGSLATDDALRPSLSTEKIRFLSIDYPLTPYLIAWFYLIYRGIISISLIASTTLYPLIFFAGSIVIFFTLVKGLFNKKTALFASMLLALLPGAYLTRTVAGFADKEAAAAFFFLAATLFYLKANKQETERRKLVYASLAGFAAALLTLAWAGAILLMILVLAHALSEISLKKFNGQKIKVLQTFVLNWFLIYILFYGPRDAMAAYLFGPALILILAAWLTNFNFWQQMELKGKLFVGTGFILLIALAGFFAGGLEAIRLTIGPMIEWGLGSKAVIENLEPLLFHWWVGFTFLLPLFLTGIVLYFLNLIKPLKEFKTLCTMAFAFLLFSLFALREFIFTGAEIFIGLTSLLILVLMGLMGLNKKNKNLSDGLKKIESVDLFLFVWFLLFFSLSFLRARFFFFLTFPAAIIAGWGLTKIHDWARLKGRFITWSISALTLIMLLLMASGSAAFTFGFKPTITPQWDSALAWIKENTPSDSLFIQSTNAGYWIQAIGKRATILDPGKDLFPEFKTLSVYFAGLKAPQAEEDLSRFKATHLLVSGEDLLATNTYQKVVIGEKAIGSQSGLFLKKVDLQEKNQAAYFFEGQAFVLDPEGFYLKGETLKIIYNKLTGKFEQPMMQAETTQIKKWITLNCLYYRGEWIEFSTGIEACAMVIPSKIKGIIDERGAVVVLPKRVLEAAWARLYLFEEEGLGYELIYSDEESHPFFFEEDRLQGPIKIWEISES